VPGLQKQLQTALILSVIYILKQRMIYEFCTNARPLRILLYFQLVHVVIYWLPTWKNVFVCHKLHSFTTCESLISANFSSAMSAKTFQCSYGIL
jgi:hypothetical protein